MIHLVLENPNWSFVWTTETRQWLLREGDLGQKSIPVREAPFVIGRHYNCQLGLPESAEFRKTTSRWHCHIIMEGKKYVLVDGSLSEIPETAKKKASISGTFLNGSRVSKPMILSPGDMVSISPWKFKVEETEVPPVDIDDMLKKIETRTFQSIDIGEHKVGEMFGPLHDLFLKVTHTNNTDEALTAILNYTTSKIRNAEVAAILVSGPKSDVSVRMAWQKHIGRVFDFHFSAGLLKKMLPDKALLFLPDMDVPTSSQVAHDISSALLVPLWGEHGKLGILYIDNRCRKAVFTREDLYLASTLGVMLSFQLVLEKQSFLKHVAENMRHYFGEDMVQMLVKDAQEGKPVQLGVRDCTATILFVDMAEFSKFSHEHTPQEVANLLNPYFQLMAECIKKHGGHVDKFIGDAVMGVFGAKPLEDTSETVAQHAASAVRCAQEMIANWSEQIFLRTGTLIPIRIGISTGKVVVGNIGFPGRMEYGTLGDAVNLASRIEKLAPPNGIALSEATHELISGDFRHMDKKDVDIKGFGPTEIWIVSK